MSWPVGAIVVCVDATSKFPETCPDPVPLVEGRHYTIDAAWTACVGIEYVRVTGFPCPKDPAFGHRKTRFRLAEGGACEAERARQMKSDEVRK